ncbi:NAD(+) synthase [Lachnotalea sp. AF33-28]|uniref:NAD(+) synthase n=1 Tax=Lachnotalea sp. AF33-28 TaxID=2292046 RepID=UPI000E4D4407|nr:NAD(+) synthase [Lachnotalea sp. AF33-28]RHP32463.1 NAD(+) synthase [Lachnotalea sp. AF33-28]
MKNGFIRMAAATPKVKVADPVYNRERICENLSLAAEKKAKVVVFPELCLTAYTCGDLFLQNSLLEEARASLEQIIAFTDNLDLIAFIGLPWEHLGKLYNVAAAVSRGRLLGLVPKTCIPNYSEFYEARHFVPGMQQPVMIKFSPAGKAPYEVPMGTDMLFQCASIPDLTVAAEICEDLWVPAPPSIRHALAGATVIVNPSASNENTGKDVYRTSLVTGQSAKLVCAYLYASAGEGESSTDLVFSGHNLIAENGTLLVQSQRFCNEITYADVDLEKLHSERRRMTTFGPVSDKDYRKISFDIELEQLDLIRSFEPLPFVPKGKQDRDKRCEEILAIQSMGLKKRLEHTGCRNAVIGISGGLDSTLALLVAVRAFDLLNIPRERIWSVTMPCFGTTDRTYQNACLLAGTLGTTLREVPIREAVRVHFRDIGQPEENRDVTYENSQARERTQVLMDLANQINGLVVGTGDMSELALGWATYNGDHMSMYGVNASVPKTLVRHLVRYFADTCQDSRLSEVLCDVLDTPVSPELLPPSEGKIAQKTEDIVGPYELHDFYLYHMLRFGYRPAKIYRMACLAFAGQYDKETVLKWLKTFYRRFFTQQFKRSCLPDGPKVGTVAVSPRGDLRMPSDACMRVWVEELEQL